MANQLKMAGVHSIPMLRTRGWSFRRIARETVARYVQQAQAPAKPATVAHTRTHGTTRQKVDKVFK